MRHALVLLAALATTPAAWALAGTVTHVTDGDTVWLRTADGQRMKLRLAGIDAPERCQAWGPEARDALSRRVMRQPVQVTTQAHDAYGRAIGRLTLQGEDVSAWMVREGHAWSQRWRRSPGPYAAQEQAARSARRGLFAHSAPVEPRAFRKAHGHCA